MLPLSTRSGLLGRTGVEDPEADRIARKTAWLDPPANELTNGYFSATLPVMENAWLRPRFAGFERFQLAALTTIGEFLRSERSCRETLTQLDEHWQRMSVVKNEL